METELFIYTVTFKLHIHPFCFFIIILLLLLLLIFVILLFSFILFFRFYSKDGGDF